MGQESTGGNRTELLHKGTILLCATCDRDSSSDILITELVLKGNLSIMLTAVHEKYLISVFT